MIRRTRWLIVALVAQVTLGAAAQVPDILDAMTSSSQALTSYSATIQMTRHEARGESVITFSFSFVPDDRMSIIYTDPASVNGQTMILNGSKFYTYIPSINRRIWQDVDDESNDQGEELGFLYDFVIRDAATFIDTNPIEGPATTETYALEDAETPLDVVKLTFRMDDGQQVVWVNQSDAVPVAVDLYDGDDLVMEIRVLEYRANEPIDDALFAIPEK
jgi:outer membrane lipoprotein-sorting protein